MLTPSHPILAYDKYKNLIQMNINTDNLINSENQQLIKFKQIVQQAIKEEKLIVESILHQPEEILSRGQRLSDKIATFGGSWKFIISFAVILTAWVLYNTLTPPEREFDPYPFILMNLFLSAIAALQAPIIMMSQNRKEERDRKRSENDYLINLRQKLK